ncbi:hypothetical protein H5410_029314 [Solanum commersonii]|uniref:Uncharacterized protein n=1 Tax=Solanum commersonii TaxID=4109 RepID=A0A9J5ZA63_SOLCO|nr:hypothetical protein H5410_029314 [Solanum commersonii]
MVHQMVKPKVGHFKSGGELYVWGTNENGCLGIGSTDVAHLPERVEGPFLRHSVSEVSCGWKHTAAISATLDLPGRF